MKVIAAILTDTHMSEKTIDLNRALFKEARQIAKSHGLNKVFHGGDFLHSRKAQTQDVLNGLLTILDDFTEDDMYLEGIPGNHDKTDYDSYESFIHPYRNHPNFILNEGYVSSPLPNGAMLDMLPFYNDEVYLKELKKGLSNVRDLNRDYYLLTHIGIDGAVMNNGVSVEGTVKTSHFKDFKKVLIGHYHDPQHMNENIVYIGASLQHNFGEDEDKGLTLLYEDGSIDTVELDFPRYVKLEVDVNKVSVKDIKDIEQEVKTSKNKIRVILTGDEADIKSFDKQRLKNAGADVKTKQNEVKKEEIDESVEVFTDTALISAFTTFCDKKEIPSATGLNYLKQILK